MFVFLRLGYCTQYNFFQFHQFAWKFCEFVFLYIQVNFYCLWILYLIICLSGNRINWLYYCKRSNSAQGSASVSVVINNGLWYLLGSMIVLSLALWETSRLASIVATLVSILPKVCKCFSFTTGMPLFVLLMMAILSQGDRKLGGVWSGEY